MLTEPAATANQTIPILCALTMLLGATLLMAYYLFQSRKWRRASGQDARTGAERARIAFATIGLVGWFVTSVIKDSAIEPFGSAALWTWRGLGAASLLLVLLGLLSTFARPRSKA